MVIFVVHIPISDRVKHIPMAFSDCFMVTDGMQQEKSFKTWFVGPHFFALKIENTQYILF